MFEDRRKLIIVSLIITLIIIIALLLLWFFWPKSQPKVIVTPTATTTAEVQILPADIAPASPQRLTEDKSYPLGLKQLAMSFAERYGSYSSDEPSLNLNDLQSLMTARLIASGKLQPQIDKNSPVFIGFSSKALSSQLSNLSASSATVIVKLQRVQTIGDSRTENTFYADLKLEAVKVGNEWKIDDVAWQ